MTSRLKLQEMLMEVLKQKEDDVRQTYKFPQRVEDILIGNYTGNYINFKKYLCLVKYN